MLHINFDNAERCDPDFLECETPSGGGSAIFDEDFEGFGTYDSEGWDNINIAHYWNIHKALEKHKNHIY